MRLTVRVNETGTTADVEVTIGAKNEEIRCLQSAATGGNKYVQQRPGCRVIMQDAVAGAAACIASRDVKVTVRPKG